MGRLRTINMRECDVEIVPCQRVGYQCPMCLQTFVPDLGGVCGMAPNAGGQKEQACDLDETSKVPYEHVLMRQAAERFAEQEWGRLLPLLLLQDQVQPMNMATWSQ